MSDLIRAAIRKTLFVAVFVPVIPCLAGTIYDNFGSSNTFTINRVYQSNFDFMATTFVSTGGGNLEDIVTPIFSLDPPVTFGLYTDFGGKPGALLEDWSVTVPGFPAQLVTLTSVQNPLLLAGTPYWFVISLTSTQKNELAWYQNNQSVNGGLYAGNSLNALLQFTPGSPTPAIQLNSTAAASTPEPSSGILIGGALLLLVAAQLHRNR
jgi:hypothetical protein